MPYSVNNNIAQINGNNGPYDNKITDPSVKYGRNAGANFKEYCTAQPDKINNDDIKKKFDDLEKLNKDMFDLSENLKQTSNPQEKKRYQQKLVNGLTQIIDEQKQIVQVLKNSDDYYLNHPVQFNLKYIPGQKVNKANLNKKALLAASYEDLGAESVPVSELDDRLRKSNPDVASKVSYKAFDTNNDGKIDIAENATAMLIEDMGSKHSKEDVLNSGEINLNADDIDGTITNNGSTNLYTFLNNKKIDENKEVIKQVHDTFNLDEAKEDFLKDENNKH